MADGYAVSAIEEAANRCSRQRNFILRGIGGGVYVDDALDLTVLRQVVQQLVDAIVYPARVTVQSAVPLRRNDWLPRVPVRVRTRHRDDAMMVIHRKKAKPYLFPQMKVSKDLTDTQRRQFADVYEELDRRRSRGQRNLRVVYLHDYPVITSC